MITANRPIRVFFNDSHANVSESSLIPQGGPSRFANLFTTHFKENYPHVELTSLLFSHNDQDSRIFLRETMRQHMYLEVVYPNTKLSNSYQKDYTKRAYLKFLTPWLRVVGEALDRARPDVVFLNGFSIANWMILEEASRRNIPICIQHAGVWKKEIQAVKKSFSPSIRRIFASLEKEIIRKATCQIFLNEFSRDTFFKVHRIVHTPQIEKRTVIIPLPIIDMPIKRVSIEEKPLYKVAIVARWDAIKNHDATLRLASYAQKTHAPFSVLAVTKWKPTPKTTLKQRYPSLVKVVPPMLPEDLCKFYASVDIVLIPSRFDTVPAILAEAVISGKPVIISDSVGWVSTYREFKLTELIIRPSASGEIIARTISQLLQKRRVYLPQFQKIQSKILREHAPKKVFEAYYRVFEELSKLHAKQK